MATKLMFGKKLFIVHADNVMSVNMHTYSYMHWIRYEISYIFRFQKT